MTIVQAILKQWSILVVFVLSFLIFSSSPAFAEREMLDKDQARFYTLMPMFMPQAQNGLNYDDLLWAMVRDQGYEAHCGQMEWQLDKDLWGAIGKFFSQETPPIESFYRGLNPTIFGEGGDGKGVAQDPYVVDFTKARIPMFRGLDSPRDLQKNSSFQGMFGANYKQTSEYMLNASGVGQNLLSSYQQCLAKAQNIVASAMICDQVVGEECTINEKFSIDIAYREDDGTSRKLRAGDTLLPGEKKTHLGAAKNSLRGLFAEIRPNLHDKELYEQVCFDITGGDSTTLNPNYEPPTASKEKIAQLREAIAEIPIDLDTLYRLAFLVLVPQQNKGKEDDGDKFYWLQDEDSGGQIDSEAHAPIFIAFKIPDFGTNKSRIAGNIDTLELTKMAIQTKEQNDKDLLDQTQKRETIYEAVKASLTIPDGDQIINCPGAYKQCLPALNRVIKDIVNGMKVRCNNDTLRIIRPTESDENGLIDTSGLKLSVGEKQKEMTAVEYIFNQEDLNWERAGDLYTPANKDVKTNEYVDPANTEVANQLHSSKTNYYEWQLVIDNDPPDLEAPIKVNAYIVLPMGETIKDVNKALSIFWDEQTFFDMIETNVIEDMIVEGTDKSKMGAIPKYYTIKDAVFGFTGIDSIRPLDERKREFVPVGPLGILVPRWITTRYTFGVGFSETKGEMLIPDFGLGFMVRKIQQVVRATYEKSYNYISSCQRVEDMFLGRCKGNPDGIAAELSFCDGEAFKNIKGIPSAGGIPEFAQSTFRNSILPLITPELIAAYKHAEEATGIPCEVVAGIHWTEAGLSPNHSVFSGAPLQTSLEKDAEAAMNHLISLFPNGFDRNNIPFEDLVAAIANYNGPGNLNCSYDLQDNPRPTRWRTGGQCEAQYFGEDHPHAIAWIDNRHDNMDLIYCMDFIEWSCQTQGTEVELQKAADYIRNWMQNVDADDRWTEERIQAHVQDAADKCFANAPLCQALSGGKKYPRYDRPGSLTTAILLNAAGSAASP